MNALTKILNITLISTALAATMSCESTKFKEYNAKPPQQGATQQEQINRIEGKILKVQPSIIGYLDVIHEIEYVILKENNGDIHTFIQPFSKAILDKTEVKIDYYPLNNGIYVEDFIETYVIQNTQIGHDNFKLDAAGVIAPQGIQYLDQNIKF
jgi:hypothetical protein